MNKENIKCRNCSGIFLDKIYYSDIDKMYEGEVKSFYCDRCGFRDLIKKKKGCCLEYFGKYEEDR